MNYSNFTEDESLSCDIPDYIQMEIRKTESFKKKNILHNNSIIRRLYSLL